MSYSLSHLPDQTLLRNLNALVSRDRATTAEMLAHLAEVDARKLYLPSGYPSMYGYCVGELGMSEDSACKRIRAARSSRQFPAILDAVKDGRLNVSAVVLLAPHLNAETVSALLDEASHKKNSEIELILARRCPRPDMREAISPLRPAPLEQLAARPVEPVSEASIPGAVQLSAARRIEPSDPRPKVTPLSPQRFGLQVTLSQIAHDKLRHAQDLLSHRIPLGDLAGVLERVLDLAIAQLEKQKFAATSKPWGSQKRSDNPRTIPAHIRRAVWERDGGQCAYVSSTGHRCSARERLEFDHGDPVARGGQATIETIRLRCRAHNQYAAECAFGSEFMRHKRQESRARAQR